MSPRNWRFFDPEDPGGAGEPTPEPTPSGDPGAVPDQMSAMREAVKAVADGIKAMSARPAAPVYVPPAAPVVDHRAALEAEALTVNDRINALGTEGKFNEALQLRDEFQRKVATTLAPKMEDRLDVKVAVATGERIARTSHADTMGKWGDEVRRTVESMPLDQRVLPDAWDRAVQQVKTNHFDEILAEHKAKITEEVKRDFIPPPSASGARGGRALDAHESKLTEAQRWGADLTGITAEAYLKQLKVEEDYEKLPFKERREFFGFPVLGVSREGDKVTPGKF